MWSNSLPFSIFCKERNCSLYKKSLTLNNPMCDQIIEHQDTYEDQTSRRQHHRNYMNKNTHNINHFKGIKLSRHYETMGWTF